MASNYAKNLIGNWETSQYEPQREVLKSRYQTNMNKLSQDLKTLNEQLARNYENARINYNNSLNDTLTNDFNNMYNAETNLANRGLTASGLLNVANQDRLNQTGTATNKALSDLMNTNKATAEGSLEGLLEYQSGVNDLATSLGKGLGDITDTETKNLQNYYNLLSDITESAAQRAAQRSSRSSSLAQDKAEEDLNEQYKILGIIDTIDNTDTTDDEKIFDLVNVYGLTRDQADRAISSKNYQETADRLKNVETNYNKTLNNQIKNPVLRSIIPAYNLISNSILQTRQNNYNKVKNELSNYTYEDLYNILNNR